MQAITKTFDAPRPLCPACGIRYAKTRVALQCSSCKHYVALPHYPMLWPNTILTKPKLWFCLTCTHPNNNNVLSSHTQHTAASLVPRQGITLAQSFPPLEQRIRLDVGGARMILRRWFTCPSIASTWWGTRVQQTFYQLGLYLTLLLPLSAFWGWWVSCRFHTRTTLQVQGLASGVPG